MSRHTLILRGDADRARAVKYVASAPAGTRLDFKAPKRTLPQNDLFWSHLGSVASQLKWHGVRLSSEDWKLVFLDALKREVRMVPNLDGNGFVNLGRSSSDLSKDEMSQLIDLIVEFGTRHGVRFIDDRSDILMAG